MCGSFLDFFGRVVHDDMFAKSSHPHDRCSTGVLQSRAAQQHAARTAKAQEGSRVSRGSQTPLDPSKLTEMATAGQRLTLI
jgi:hypothetical protein